MEYLNSGSLIFYVGLMISVGLLILTMLFLFLLRKKKGLANLFKVFSLIFMISTFAFSILAPMTYFNVIDVNLRFGNFTSVNEDGSRYKFHRSGFEHYNQYGSHDGEGKWEVKRDILTLYYSDNSKMVFDVGGFGTELLIGGQLKYRFSYMN